MKTTLLLVFAAAIGFAAGWTIISKRQAARHAAAMAQAQAAWDAERAALEESIDAARARVPFVVPPATAPTAAVTSRPTPTELIAKLQTLRGGNPRQLREAVYWLAELAQHGPAALPVIREFLGRNQDIDFDTASFTQNKNLREVPLEFALPPSLRFGLFDVLRQIGGEHAEQILA